MISHRQSRRDIEAVGLEPARRGQRKESPAARTLRVLRTTGSQHKQRIHSALDHRAKGLVLDGYERASGEALSVCYFGTQDNLDYLLQRLFQTYEVRHTHVSLPTWRGKAYWDRYVDQVDLLLGDVPWPYHKLFEGPGASVSPAWIQQYIAIEEDWQATRAKFHHGAKSDLRQIERMGLRCQVSQREDHKQSFYDDFYLPLMQSRHGTLGRIEPRARVNRLCETGQLMQILREDTVIAAGLMHDTGNRLGLLWCGMPTDVSKHQATGAFAALYYFAVVHAYERGYSEINLNYSRALLNDGVYRYKRKWGSALRSGYNLEYLVFKPNRPTPGVAAFLEHNPFVAQEGRRLVARVRSDTRLDTQAAMQLAKSNWIDGLDRLRIYAQRGIEHGAAKALAARYRRTELVDLLGINETASAVCA